MTEAECELLTGKLMRPDTVRTPKGRLSYAHVFTPALQMTKLRFSTSLCFPPDADLTILKSIIEDRAKLRFGNDYQKKYPKLKIPIYTTSDYPKMGIDPTAFPTFIRAGADANSAYEPPKIVDIHNNTLTKERDEALAYSGRWAVLLVNTYGYDTEGNRGISLGLQGVQLREDGERLGGGGSLAPDDFVAIPINESADNLFRSAV